VTVLAACQSAFVRLVGRKPTTIFSSPNQMELEIADLATDVAVDIMKSNEWRVKTLLHTLTGDGVTSSFPLPPDYDRMALAQHVHDPNNWLWGYTAVESLDEWMLITTSHFYGIPPGWWIILGGTIQFAPTPAAGTQAMFAYISKNIGSAADGSAIMSFTKDDDTFILDERLLTLGLIWRWKAQKGLEYAEDMTNYEIALTQAQARDKGSSAIRKGWPHLFPRTGYAWPWPLG
jgi:hypothetical protein